MMLYYQRYSTVTDWPSTFGRFACKEILLKRGFEICGC